MQGSRIGVGSENSAATEENQVRWDLRKILKKFELRFIYRDLAASNGNMGNAAKLLGISRESLHMKIHRKNINVEDFRL